MFDLGFAGWVGAVWLIVDWVLRIVALFVVPRNRKPSAATAWLLFIFFLPILGMLVYLIIGNPKLPKSRRNAQATLDGVIAKILKELRQDHDREKLLSAAAPERYQQIANLSESLSHLPVFSGNKLALIPDYQEVIDSIVADIDAAKDFIHLEYFIIALDDTTEPIFDAIARAVKRGVTVRVLYDSFSTKRYPGWKNMLQRLADDGAEAHAILPFKLPGKGYVRPDLRNHRKLVVIDGQIGYTGSQNLVQRDYHRKDDIEYDELVVRIQGPVALQLAAVFLTDWYSETGQLLDYKDRTAKLGNIKNYGDSLAQVLPSGPGYDDENNLKLFTSLIHAANERITIVNPYFIPDDALTNALTSAAKRGVVVTMINSEVMDQWMVGHAQRSFYEAFLQANVNIYLYKSPVLLHSKFMSIDDGIAVIGSSNMDIRSFLLNLEITLISYDPAVVQALHKIESTYLARSTKLTLTQWHARSRRQHLFENIARLTSALQ